MKNLILTITISAIAMAISACGGASTPANANKPANTTNTTSATPASSPAASNSNSTASTDGSVLKIEEGGVQMNVPKGFKIEKSGEDTLVSTADEGVAVRFHVPADGDYDKARQDAAKNIDEYINEVKIEQKDKKETINGMEALSYSGTGKDKENGKTVNWELTILKTDKKPVLAIIYAEEASMEKNAKELAEFFNSVKKL